MCKHDDGCNAPEGECSGACMTQQTSGETLEEISDRAAHEIIAKRHRIGENSSLFSFAIAEDFARQLLSKPAILDHIPAVKALREENERLKYRLEYSEDHHWDGIASRDQTIRALESQLAELRQGGEGNCPAGLQMHFAATEEGDACPFCETPQPAIPPGYAVVPETAPRYLPAYGTYDFEWLKWAVGEARGNPVEWDESCFVGHHPAHVNNLNSLNRIVTAAVQHALTAAPSVPVAESEG